MRSTTGMSAFADGQGFSVVYPDAHRVPPPVVSTPTPPSTPPPPSTPTPTPTPTPTSNAARLSAVRAADARALNEAQAGSAGTGRAWNAGFCCAGAAGDDVTYLRHVVAAAVRSTRVDMRRIYVVGLSNGGMMAIRAICEAPELFAAAGSVAGPYLGSRCGRPAWLHLHGGSDPVVPFSGGVPPGVPGYGVLPDWCHCRFPASATEPARFGPYVATRFYRAGTHSWPTPGSVWRLDGNATLWSALKLFRH
jgi:dienelactone hydrolase